MIDEKPRTHVCQTPPIAVPSWPRAERVDALTAGDDTETFSGPEKRSQAPLGTIWICGKCHRVWEVAIRPRETSCSPTPPDHDRVWITADIWTTARELRKAGYETPRSHRLWRHS